MAVRWSKKVKVLAVVLILLVAFRLALPSIVTRYVNSVLADIPGYRGSIHDVDLHLIRGAYRIDSLKLFRVEGNREIPFVNIPLTDLSVEWSALLDGRVVGEIAFDQPELNFITAKEDEGNGAGSGQTGEDVDWTAPIKELFPFKINRLEINDGKVAFYDFSTEPKVDLFLHNLRLQAENLTNASGQNELLPSRVFLQARSIGNGQLSASMKINVLKEVPDLDLDLKFENVNLTALNDFFGAYAKIDVEEGRFDLYAEVAVLEGKIDGYVKPLLNNLRVVDWSEDKKEPLKLAWESIAGFFLELFENQPENQFATRVPLEGQISAVESKFWPTLWNIFQNAFVQAFEQNTDDAISIGLADVSGSTDSKDDKALRKEKRNEKREKRREERRARREARRNGDDSR